MGNRHSNSTDTTRSRQLVEAAYLTFLESGIKGMTMARIGERAGMSHGIVNYYFKSKDDLLVAVVRKQYFMIRCETVRLLREASSPRDRVSAVIAANLPPHIFTQEGARAWVSYYAIISENPDFERLQNASDHRMTSNLAHALKQLTDTKRAESIAIAVALLIDGLWLRHAKSSDRMNSTCAIRLVESFVDQALA